MVRHDTVSIKLNEELLYNLIKSNLACYHNQALTLENIELLSKQIVESIDYFINDNLK